MSLTEEQRKIRATRVTSTDIARIAGLDRYAGPLRVYLDKVGEADPEPPSSYGEAGSALEEPVAQLVAERDGLVLINPGTILSWDHGIVAATPDRIRLDGESWRASCPAVLTGLGEAARDAWREVVEIKTVWTPAAREDYGEQDTDRIPLRHLCQVTWEMLATGLRRARLYAFCPEPGVSFADAVRRYVIPFDHEFAADLLDQAERFWRDHVLPRVSPPLDASEEAERYLKRRFPRSTGSMRAAPPAIASDVGSLTRLKEEQGELEEAIAQLENRVKAFIGDADGIETPDGDVTWRSSKAKDRLDSEALAREPGIAALIAKHTKVGKAGEGPRVFRGPWSNRR